jgi:hypothetical protein
MSVEIRVLGEFDFIKQIIEGVTRVFSTPGVMNTASGILLMLLLLWASLAHIMNPDKAPFPFREFLMGLIGWIVFASPMSPKYDVELTSIRNVSEFTVINDVPFLAAIPSAIASNFFSGLREIMEISFSPVTYSSSDRQADPLSTLVKMYDQRPPTSMQFNTGETGYDLGKSVSNYVKNCYLADHELRGRDPTKPINFLRTATISVNLFSELSVAYNFLQTDIYLTPGGSHFGEYVDCPTAFTRIKAELTSASLKSKIIDFYDDKGISQAAIKESTAMVYGAYGTGPTPYDIQIGMLQSYMIRDGLQNTSLETFTDQMVLQGMRKRVYEKAGERALFNQIAIPVITALECFAFYMAPIMMLLSVLGGAGFAMVKKYLMLILFVNLWGFISIFVNLYTAISVENALGVSAGFDPFSFDSLPDTILEVEGFLATAAALTASIPMLAMFLLYGGVHSMMGVMRNVSSGSVDGNMGAPTVSSNMNNAVLKIGDTTRTLGVSTGAYAEGHTISNNQQYGTASVGGTETSGWGASTQTIQGQVAATQTSYQQSLNQAIVSGIGSTSSNDVQNAANWSNMNTDTKLSTLANTEKKDETFSNAEKAQMALSAAAAAGVSLPGGIAGAKAQASLSTAQEESDTYKEMVDRAKSFQDSGTTSKNSSDSSGTSNSSSDSKTWSDNESSQEAKAALQSYQETLAKSKALSDTISSGSVIASTIQLNNAQAAAVMDPAVSGWSHLDKLAAGLNRNEIEQLKELRQEGGNSFEVMQNWVSQLGDKDSSLKEDAEDKALSSKIMGFIGESLGKEAGAGFFAAADIYQQMSQSVLDVDSKDYGLTQSEADNNQKVTHNAAEDAKSTLLTDKTDTVTPNIQEDATGFVGPTKEELERQEQLSERSLEVGKLDNGRTAMSFFDKNQGWDDGNIPHSVNEHAVGKGVTLPSIYHGMDALVNGDFSGFTSKETTDALVAQKYLAENKDLYQGMDKEQRDHIAKNLAEVTKNATPEERAHAEGIYSGTENRDKALMGYEDGHIYAIKDPYAIRVAEQVTAMKMANGDSADPKVNYNGNADAGGVIDVANLASQLSSKSMTPEQAYDIGKGGDSLSGFLRFMALSSDEELTVAGAQYADVLTKASGGNEHTSANVAGLIEGLRDGNAYIPDPIYSPLQKDGTLGQSVSANGETYTLSNSEDQSPYYNTYTDSNGKEHTQPRGNDFMVSTATTNKDFNTTADNANDITTSALTPIVGENTARFTGSVVEEAVAFASMTGNLLSPFDGRGMGIENYPINTAETTTVGTQGANAAAITTNTGTNGSSNTPLNIDSKNESAPSFADTNISPSDNSGLAPSSTASLGDNNGSSNTPLNVDSKNESAPSFADTNISQSDNNGLATSPVTSFGDKNGLAPSFTDSKTPPSDNSGLAPSSTASFGDNNGSIKFSESNGINEVKRGEVSSDEINHDEGIPALNLVGGVATVDGVEYKAAGQHTIGEGSDQTVLGNKYSTSDGDHYYLHDNKMKIILD